MKIYRLISFLLFITALASLTACGSTVNINGTWKLISYGNSSNQTDAVSDANNSIIIGTDGKISGSVGCNSISGDYKTNGNQIAFGAISSTMMACADPIMTQESSVFQVLTGTAKYALEGNRLTITNGENLIIFEISEK